MQSYKKITFKLQNLAASVICSRAHM